MSGERVFHVGKDLEVGACVMSLERASEAVLSETQ